MKFLHLSDFHFGIEKRERYSSGDVAARKNSMRKVTEKIISIANSEHLDFIFLTGDFGWSASKEDYKKCREWLQQLLNDIDLDASKIFLCPGNHDIDRETMLDIEYPLNQVSANQKLKIERLDYLNGRFNNFINFYNELKIKPYLIGSKESTLVGIRETEKCIIVCLNTAWFAKNDDVQDKMWIGADLIEIIRSQLNDYPQKPVITIMHHPMTSWHEEERGNFEGTENVYSEVCKFSDIVLHGHTHETETQSFVFNNALIAGSGAIYQSRHYPHNFYLYDVDFIDSYASQIRKQYYLHNNKWLTMEEKLYDPSESIYLAPWVMKNNKYR